MKGGVNKSLRWRLMVVIGLSLVSLWLVLAPWLLYTVRVEMERTLDDRLAASARMMVSLINRQQLSQPDAESTDLQMAMSEPPFPSSLACRVSTLEGEVLAMSQDAPNEALQAEQNGYHYRTVEGQSWRVYTMTEGEVRVTTAERVSRRESLLASVRLAAALPFALSLLGTLVLTWFGIQRAFRPLQRLSRSVASRDLEDPRPLAWNGFPAEVGPLVTEINQLLDRVQQAVRREREFTDDAAHELRTPLTAIKTQLQVARMTEGEASRHSLNQAERALEGLQSTFEQLLLLARLEGRPRPDDSETSTAEEITATALADLSWKIEQKRLRVSYHSACEDSGAFEDPVQVPSGLATTALRNLLDNAIRYSPEQSTVQVETERQGHYCVWTISDEGPGVDEGYLHTMVQRFAHRSPGGSGLGLAIVDAIAQRFGGRLDLANKAKGFEATLSLPCSDTS